MKKAYYWISAVILLVMAWCLGNSFLQYDLLLMIMDTIPLLMGQLVIGEIFTH